MLPIGLGVGFVMQIIVVIVMNAPPGVPGHGDVERHLLPLP